MNDAVFIKGVEVCGNVDGREAVKLAERAWWQSRMTGNGKAAELPDVIHPAEILKEHGYEARE